MAPKRKSDVVESAVLDALDTNSPIAVASGSSSKQVPLEPAPKKLRLSASSLGPEKKDTEKPKFWHEVELEEMDSGGVPVYDDCGDIRRKIRLLQQTPDWKVTYWLQEIGNVNSNSYNRFMSAKGKYDGASNGTYYCAYVYFEKVRILEGKKKTPKRKNNEKMHPKGFLC